MGRKLSILCVDDDPDIRMIAVMALGLDPDITVQAASSAEDALVLLRGEGCHMDAILLDVMMPEMQGPEAMAEIRSIESCASVPIIFLTARARTSDVESYRAAGAAGVIVKPFDPLTLPGQLRAIVEGV